MEEIERETLQEFKAQALSLKQNIIEFLALRPEHNPKEKFSVTVEKKLDSLNQMVEDLNADAEQIRGKTG
jgi:hypothetical protein